MTDRTAFLNYREQKTAFLDVPDLTALDGTPLHAGAGQPLFHVERSVGGSELLLLNQWRIVHLTEAHRRLTAVFEHMAASPWIAGHTEIYIRHDLGIKLTRRHTQGQRPPQNTQSRVRVRLDANDQAADQIRRDCALVSRSRLITRRERTPRGGTRASPGRGHGPVLWLRVARPLRSARPGFAEIAGASVGGSCLAGFLSRSRGRTARGGRRGG